jgi:hypothetical protein
MREAELSATDADSVFARLASSASGRISDVRVGELSRTRSLWLTRATVTRAATRIKANEAAWHRLVNNPPPHAAPAERAALPADELHSSAAIPASCAGVGTLLGIIGGVLPALKASKVEPVRALRG